MQNTDILNTLDGIFRQVLRREDIRLTEETVAGDIPGWDSLTHMTLLYEVEKKFGIKFAFREILRFRQVGDLCRAIAEKIG